MKNNYGLLAVVIIEARNEACEYGCCNYTIVVETPDGKTEVMGDTQVQYPSGLTEEQNKLVVEAWYDCLNNGVVFDGPALAQKFGLTQNYT